MKTALGRTRTEAGDYRYEHYDMTVGLAMFMFTDEIFVSMRKSHLHNDTVDQQERVSITCDDVSCFMEDTIDMQCLGHELEERHQFITCGILMWK